ncbi:MAG TPA: cell division protein FtsZ [Candidatus Limnocylindrales bacterium]|nr:cell division protein FtsZ [Candidatus Limnocylindrales bacterium]
MKTKVQASAAMLEPAKAPAVKIFGVGSAGVTMLDLLNSADFADAGFVAVNTDAPSLAASSAPVKIQLETKLLRGLGTGGDPERGGAIAEEQFATLKTACEGADVVFVVAGLGGGAGSGISPVLARAAKEAGALVLAFVTLPFVCEGNRRQQQAQQGLDRLKSVADGVISLPCQKTFKLIDENTSVLDTFRITGGLLVESVRGVWCLLTRPGLIRIHFDDLCALVRDRHSESVFASVDATGPARAREVVEKLIAHPLLDEGRALAESGAVLVSLMGGKDLTMAEVNRVMEQIGRHCERAEIIMGAAVDETQKNRLSVTVIAAKQNPVPMELPPLGASGDSSEQVTARGIAARSGSRCGSSSPGLTSEQREQILTQRGGGRGRKGGPKMRQAQLPLAIITKGRFDKSEPTIHKGEDLDIPTYVRRGIALN